MTGFICLVLFVCVSVPTVLWHGWIAGPVEYPHLATFYNMLDWALEHFLFVIHSPGPEHHTGFCVWVAFLIWKVYLGSVPFNQFFSICNGYWIFNVHMGLRVFPPWSEKARLLICFTKSRSGHPLSCFVKTINSYTVRQINVPRVRGGHHHLWPFPPPLLPLMPTIIWPINIQFHYLILSHSDPTDAVSKP